MDVSLFHKLQILNRYYATLGYTQMDEDLNEMSSQFHKQKDRLKELREKKPEPSKFKLWGRDRHDLLLIRLYSCSVAPWWVTWQYWHVLRHHVHVQPVYSIHISVISDVHLILCLFQSQQVKRTFLCGGNLFKLTYVAISLENHPECAVVSNVKRNVERRVPFTKKNTLSNRSKSCVKRPPLCRVRIIGIMILG